VILKSRLDFSIWVVMLVSFNEYFLI